MIKKFTDERGDFVIYDASQCNQVNVVTNTKVYTFRGLHYQTNPPQKKTVKVIQGKVLDFLYDLDTKELLVYTLDKDSPPLVVGKQYAHGYLTLESDTIFTYAVEGEYNPDSEHSIVWDTIDELKEIIIEYIDQLVISDKDKKGK